MRVLAATLRGVCVVTGLAALAACGGKSDSDTYRSLKASVKAADEQHTRIATRLDTLRATAARDTALRDLVKDPSSLTYDEYSRILAATLTGRDTPERTALRQGLKDLQDSVEFTDRQQRIAAQALRNWLHEAPRDRVPQGNLGSIVAAFLGVLTAMIGTWIAWQQHRATRSKLRLDLYDRRFAVAEGINRLLSKIVANANMGIEDLHAYNADTAHAQFLFDADFFAYVEEIRTKALEFRINRQKLDQMALLAPQLREAVVERDAELLKWFNEQFGVYRAKLSRYIQFQDAL